MERLQPHSPFESMGKIRDGAAVQTVALGVGADKNLAPDSILGGTIVWTPKRFRRHELLQGAGQALGRHGKVRDSIGFLHPVEQTEMSPLNPRPTLPTRDVRMMSMKARHLH